MIIGGQLGIVRRKCAYVPSGWVRGRGAWKREVLQSEGTVQILIIYRKMKVREEELS